MGLRLATGFGGLKPTHSLARSQPIKVGCDTTSHAMAHRVPSVCSPDNYCCRRIPLRVNAPLKFGWSSLTNCSPEDENMCSSSNVSLWLARNSFRIEP